jgi:(p)ppGpp synthase/HD superfamily hydrolase
MQKGTSAMPETERFQEALTLAAELHAGQTRKGTEVPYISHLLGVTALVLQDGGGEDEAIAALLHDAAEDRGGEETLALIRQRFGEQVAEIVEAASDTLEDPKPPWRERKEAHLAHVKGVSPQTCRVLLADKLYNARSVLRDLRLQGNRVWDKFKGKKDGTLWYYRQMHTLLAAKKPGYLADELGRVLAEIERIADE